MQARTAALRTLLSSFPFGDATVDIRSRFDYLVVSGAFGFGDDFTENDPLVRQMRADNILSGFVESEPTPPLKHVRNPLRVFYTVRPRVSRMDVHLYTTSRALPFTNVCVACDLFCARPFLSVFGEYTPSVQLHLEGVQLSGNRLPAIVSPEVQITADFVEGCPLVGRLQRTGSDYSAVGSSIPALTPCVCNREYLRLQSLTFSVFGRVDGTHSRRTHVASGVLPLKSVLNLGARSAFAVPLYYHSCFVGQLRGELLEVYCERNEAELAAAGIGNERYVSVVSYYENQVRNHSSGRWVPATFAENAAFPFSTADPEQPQRKELLALPNTATWRWLYDWRCDGRPDDPEGWTYAPSFTQPFELAEDSSSQVRRRRWSRAMQAQDALEYHHFLEAKMQARKA